MEMLYFVVEFFADWRNLIPSAVIGVIASLAILLWARHRMLSNPVLTSLLLTSICTFLVFGALLLSAGISDRQVFVVFNEALFWTGLAFSTLLAWPVALLVALGLRRRQRMTKSSDTSAFQ